MEIVLNWKIGSHHQFCVSQNEQRHKLILLFSYQNEKYPEIFFSFVYFTRIRFNSKPVQLNIFKQDSCGSVRDFPAATIHLFPAFLFFPPL